MLTFPVSDDGSRDPSAVVTVSPMDIPRAAHWLIARRAHKPGWNVLWTLARWRWADREVKTKLHGQRAVINFANPYPTIASRIPEYNRPQILAVRAVAEALGRPVHVVDVGAAMGDTALKLYSECRNQIASMTCIEGNAKFARMLRTNLTAHGAIVRECVLSDSEGTAPELVHNQHPGTASATGSSRVPTTTLDQLLGGETVDVLKIDTDGYDGLVLAGGRAVLQQRPVVLFEWHPVACGVAGTDERLAFDVLRDYPCAVWFTKYGVFSHVTYGIDNAMLDAMAKICLEADLPDWHYDVIALPPDSRVSLTRLASTGSARG
jgi:FkbM family methyltransferase